ncbi:MAG: NAD-dependent epimerase/dehydratase family protein [Leucobacter sp.]
MTHSHLEARSLGRVLVTGGAGFIGTAIAPLLRDTQQVVAFDNLHPQIHASGTRPDALAEHVELVVGDVSSAADWDRVLDDISPDTVIHLAAETGTGQSLSESTRHAMVNVVGTTQMLDALRRHDRVPERIVLTSSRAIYGEGAWADRSGRTVYPGQRSVAQLEAGQWDFPEMGPLPMNAEEVQPNPVSVYAATKLAQEHLLRTWADSYEVQAVILRLQNVYGPGQSLINPYTGIMSLFCRMAMGGKSIPLYEDGEVRRDFVLIDDVARAVVAAAKVASAPRSPLDIGLGTMHTIADAAQLISAEYGAPAPHVSGAYRLGDVRHAWADISRAQEALGWTPQHDLRDGIHRLVDWINAQPDVRVA